MHDQNLLNVSKVIEDNVLNATLIKYKLINKRIKKKIITFLDIARNLEKEKCEK